MLMSYLNTPEKLNRRLVHSPMGRFGEAVEQAKAVVFCSSVLRSIQAGTKLAIVASDDSSFVTGSDFLVDGGLTACYVVSVRLQRVTSIS